MHNYFELEEARLDRMKAILKRIRLRTEQIDNLRAYVKSANGFDGLKAKSMEQIKNCKRMGNLLCDAYQNQLEFLNI